MCGDTTALFVESVDVERHAMSEQGVQCVVLTNQLFQHRIIDVATDVADGELSAWVDDIGDVDLLSFDGFVELDICVHISFVVHHLPQILNGTFSLALVVDDGILSNLAEQTCCPVRGIDTSETVDLEGYLRSKPFAVGGL